MTVLPCDLGVPGIGDWSQVDSQTTIVLKERYSSMKMAEIVSVPARRFRVCGCVRVRVRVRTYAYVCVRVRVRVRARFTRVCVCSWETCGIPL